MHRDEPTAQETGSSAGQGRCVSTARKASEVISLGVWLAGTAILCVCILDAFSLKLPSYFVTLKSDTAFCFMLMGAALWLSQKRQHARFSRLGAAACSLLLLFIGAGLFYQYVFGADVNSGTMAPRMAFSTAVNVMLIGAALLLLRQTGKLSFYLVQALALVVGFNAILSFIGYIYGVSPLYIPGNSSVGMSIHTAVLFILTVVGILFCHPDRGLMAHVTSSLSGGRMLRRILPGAVVAPVIIGFIETIIERFGLLSNEFSGSLVAIGNLSFIAGYIYFFSVLLNRSDDKRARMEETLRVDEARYRALFSRMTSGAAIYEVRDGGRDFVFKDINLAGERISRIKRVDVVGKGVSEVFPGVKAMGLFDVFLRVWQTGVSEYFPVFLYKDARVEHWVENRVYKLPGGEIIAIYDDVTERKRAEEAIKSSRDYLDKIINAITDPIFVKDQEFRWVLFNDAFCHFMGRGREELSGKTDYDFLPKEEADVFRDKDIEVFRSSRENINEESLTDSAGETKTIATKKTVYVDPQGKKFIVGIIRDISERKRLEQDLLNAAFEWRRTFDSITDFVFLLDNESRVLRANRAMAQAMGVSPQEMVGRACRDLVKGMDNYWVNYPFERLLTDGKPYVEEVTAYDGKVLLATVSPVFNDKNGIVGSVHIAQDITAHKEAEKRLLQANEELRSAKDQLVQSEKMASIGQLAAGVAHEINNPVGFISSNMEVMTGYIAAYLKMVGLINKVKDAMARKACEEAQALMEEIKKFEEEVNFDYMVNDSEALLKQSREGMQRIEKIVLDLKNFAREETEWLEDLVSIESVVETAIGLTHNEIKYRAELRKDYGNVSAVRCNVQKMSQVFVNLLVNAGHAIKERGTIDVKTYEKAGYVCVEITDSGCGIPAENMKRIFDPFFTTKPVGQGTGLGLSISYEIVKKQKGEIRVSSQVGQGTTFTVLLPIPLKKQEKKV